MLGEFKLNASAPVSVIYKATPILRSNGAAINTSTFVGDIQGSIPDEYRANVRINNGKVLSWTSANNAGYITVEDTTDLVNVVDLKNNCAITTLKDIYCWDLNGIAIKQK